jgi:uncharacterized protein YjiS (DUF1127 family)
MALSRQWLQARTQRNRRALAKHTEQAYATAIAELREYNDRELADLGLHRAEIEYAVRYGRAGVAADAQTATQPRHR